jgi:hypothetical protein
VSPVRGGGPTAKAASSSEDNAATHTNQCFEQACQDAPFIMHASRTANSSADPQGAIMACFEFVAIGCYAAPKGCCPQVARHFTGLEFAISECTAVCVAHAHAALAVSVPQAACTLRLCQPTSAITQQPHSLPPPRAQMPNVVRTLSQL